MTHTIEYRTSTALPADQAAELYNIAGWLRPGEGADLVRIMLDRSFAAVGAFTGEQRLIGMMRALSDGIGDAYLLDLVVHPDFRGAGIGKTILERLVNELRRRGIDWIVCIGAPGTESFYAKTSATPMTGFTPFRFEGDAP